MTRTIDPEHNWFWQEGYKDAFAGNHADPPDEARTQYHRGDYFAGYDAGREDREAYLEARSAFLDAERAGDPIVQITRHSDPMECPHCGGTNTRRLSATQNGVFPEEHECFDCRGIW